MNQYIRLYFNIMQDREIKETLYDNLTFKEKRNFVRFQSVNVKKSDDRYDPYKLDKFSMKIIELLLVLAIPILLNLILISIIFITNLFTNDYQFNIIEMNHLSERISFYIYLITYLAFILINILNIKMIGNYYGVKYNFIKDYYYSYYESNYVYHFIMNRFNLTKIYDHTRTFDVQNKINYKLHVLYNKLQYLKPNYLKRSINHYENNLMKNFNTLYIDRDATHMMYGYELINNLELLNKNKSTQCLNQIKYNLNDDYISLNEVNNKSPEIKYNDHLKAMIKSTKLNKSKLSSFKELVELIQHTLRVEYYHNKIKLLDQEEEKLKQSEKRLKEIYDKVYRLDDNQVNAYDLRIKRLEQEIKELKQ